MLFYVRIFSSIDFPPTFVYNHMYIFLGGSTGYIYLGDLLYVLDSISTLGVHSRLTQPCKGCTEVGKACQQKNICNLVRDT